MMASDEATPSVLNFIRHPPVAVAMIGAAISQSCPLSVRTLWSRKRPGILVGRCDPLPLPHDAIAEVGMTTKGGARHPRAETTAVSQSSNTLCWRTMPNLAWRADPASAGRSALVPLLRPGKREQSGEQDGHRIDAAARGRGPLAQL